MVNENISRIGSLNLLRTFALFLVILDHASSWENFFQISDLKIYYFIQSIAKMGVPLFLTISGYLLLDPKVESIKTFLIKRARRILPPFIAWSYIYIYMQKVCPLEDWQRAFPTETRFGLLNILISPAYGHLWYIYLLIGLYLAVPFLWKINRNLTNEETIYLLIIIIIKIIAAFLQGVLGRTIVNSSTLVTMFCDYIIFFEGGYLLRKYEPNIHKHRTMCWVVLCGSILLNWATICFFSPDIVDKTVFLGGNSPLMITATFGLWGGVVGRDISNIIIKKICDKIAVLSFQAYFVHMIFLWVN